MKRGAAALAAIGLVAAALAVRSRIDGGGSAASGSGRRAVVACVTELAGACKEAYGSSADVRVEDAATTARALLAGTATIDDWVTLSGWPELVALRPASPALRVTAVASTPIVVAAERERAAALTASCGDAGWRCLLTAVGRPWTDFGGRAEWGAVKVAVGAKSTALGLVVRANALSALAQAGIGVGTNDSDFASAVGAVDRADGSADPLTGFFLVFPATYAAVGTTAARLEAGVGAYRDRVTSATPAPPAQAIAVVARVAGRPAIDGDSLAKALTGARWTAPPATGAGLPDPGVLLTLAGI